MHKLARESIMDHQVSHAHSLGSSRIKVHLDFTKFIAEFIFYFYIVIKNLPLFLKQIFMPPCDRVCFRQTRCGIFPRRISRRISTIPGFWRSGMRIIAVTSQKGGSGKTTITGHLAVEAARTSGEPVALIDTDPQGSLSDWWNERKNEEPAFAQATLATLDTDLNALRDEGIRTVFIDTPPAITGAIQAVVQKSDLIIIPTRPSPHDLRAAGKTVDLVERAGKPLVFVVNGATARARLTGQAAIALSQHGTVAPTILHNRQDFAASMIDGRTVMEASAGGKSAEEVTALWSYINDRIRRLPMKVQFKSVQMPRAGFGNRSQAGAGNLPQSTGL